MLKAKVNIRVDRRLITLFKPFFRGKASYGPQVDQSQRENRLSDIIMIVKAS